MYRTLKSPFNVQVEITWACDNACRHCYNAYRHDNTPLCTLSGDQIEKVVEELARWQVLRAVITGGEPLLYPNKVFLMAKLAANSGIGVALNSNLRRFDRATGEKLRELGVGVILTSLIADNPQTHDFITQREGSHKETCEGIHLAVEMGFRTVVNMVISRWNVDRVWQTGNLAGELGVAKFGVTRASAPASLGGDFLPRMVTAEEVRDSLATLWKLRDRWGYEVDIFEHYPWCLIRDVATYHYLARRSCSAGVTGCTIGADGSIRACSHSSRSYGNVFTDGLREAWLGMDGWRKQVYAPPICTECQYFHSCGGGCPAEAEVFGRELHCTGEQDVIPPRPRERREVDCSGSFRFREDCLLREENFGGVLGNTSGRVLLVGGETFRLLCSLSRRTFTLAALVEEFDVELEGAELLVSQLVTKNLVERR